MRRGPKPLRGFARLLRNGTWSKPPGRAWNYPAEIALIFWRLHHKDHGGLPWNVAADLAGQQYLRGRSSTEKYARRFRCAALAVLAAETAVRTACLDAVPAELFDHPVVADADADVFLSACRGAQTDAVRAGLPFGHYLRSNSGRDRLIELITETVA